MTRFDAMTAQLLDAEGDRLALIASRFVPAFVSLALVAAAGGWGL